LIFTYNNPVNAELKWYYGNSSTLAWNIDLEITLSDRTKEIIPEDQISYKIFCTPAYNPDKNNPILVAETNVKSYKLKDALEILEEGSYYFGVQMIRTEEDKEPATSPIGWSDNPDNISAEQINTFAVFVFNTLGSLDQIFVKTDFTPPAIPQDVIAE
jgi:hypothetical protein